MNKKIKRFFGMLKYSNFRDEVVSCGSDFTLYNFVIALFAVLVVSFIVGFLLKLQPSYATVVVGTFVVFTPSMILTKFKYSYEKTRFNETVSYLEQMVYSFKKKQKIKVALEDVRDISSGKIKSTIKRVIDYIDNGSSNGDLYTEAFSILEKKYNCTRIKTLHAYLVEVENNGGNTDKSLGVILEDIRGWSLRVLDFQQQRKQLKVKVGISILLAMFTCGMMLNLIPAEYVVAIIASPVYQVATVIVLLSCVVLFVFANNKLGGSYLDLEVEGENYERVLKDYHYVADFGSVNHIKPSVIKCCLLAPIIAVQVYLEIYWVAFPTAFFAVFMLFQPTLKRNNARKHVTREINRVFPNWIRNLVLHLQTDNVQVAIRNSLASCPEILKPEIRKLLIGLDESPSSMKPYLNFLADYELSNLKLSVNFLYALSEFGSDDMISQLDYLVQQNNALTISSEKIQNEDALAGLSTMILAPMLISVVKLIVDMILFFTTFMGYIGTIGGT